MSISCDLMNTPMTFEAVRRCVHRTIRRTVRRTVWPTFRWTHRRTVQCPHKIHIHIVQQALIHTVFAVSVFTMAFLRREAEIFVANSIKSLNIVSIFIALLLNSLLLILLTAFSRRQIRHLIHRCMFSSHPQTSQTPPLKPEHEPIDH